MDTPKPLLWRLLRLHEGLKLQVYRCTAGRRTIGIGRNLDDNPLTSAEIAHLGRASIAETGITEEEAWWLLDADIAKATAELRRALPFFPSLDEVRQAVLIDMCYNLGWPKLSLFRQTLAAMAAQNYRGAAGMMLRSRWAIQVGKLPNQRAGRLSRMMETGQWPAGLPG